MSDIKLNLSWDIDPNGDIEISVSPDGSDLILAQFTIDEEEIASELADDLILFDQGEPDSIFIDWENLVDAFRHYADQIEKLVTEAKEQRGWKK